ncbi:MAG: YHS domain-containing protein [Gammaproteobacteria bacterium]|nr:YHS domain-containing protein [Gammaproteobacteria bacterium]
MKLSYGYDYNRYVMSCFTRLSYNTDKTGMTKMNGIEMVQDPVCLMSIDPKLVANTIMHNGKTYYFCSDQCRNRFEANLHLYIGLPGHPAPKQHGHEVIKKRSLKLKRPLTENQSSVIVTDLENMMGIKNVHVEAGCIYITYDLLQATVEQIEMTIVKTGEKLGSGLAENLKRAFIHYLEETELENLENPGQEHSH